MFSIILIFEVFIIFSIIIDLVLGSRYTYVMMRNSVADDGNKFKKKTYLHLQKRKKRNKIEFLMPICCIFFFSVNCHVPFIFQLKNAHICQNITKKKLLSCSHMIICTNIFFLFLFATFLISPKSISLYPKSKDIYYIFKDILLTPPKKIFLFRTTTHTSVLGKKPAHLRIFE